MATQLQRLESKLEEHSTQLATITEQNKNQYKTLRKLEAALLGNGKEGLIVCAERHKTYFKILGIAIVVIGTALVGVIIEKLT